jgi:hypothetical protein
MNSDTQCETVLSSTKQCSNVYFLTNLRYGVDHSVPHRALRPCPICVEIHGLDSLAVGLVSRALVGWVK